MEELIEFLEKKIKTCTELGGMELERFAFIVTLKKARKIVKESKLEVKKLSFSEWKYNEGYRYLSDHTYSDSRGNLHPSMYIGELYQQYKNS